MEKIVVDKIQCKSTSENTFRKNLINDLHAFY